MTRITWGTFVFPACPKI